MSLFNDKKKKGLLLTLVSVILVLAIAVGVCAFYLGDYYRADTDAIGAFLPQGSSWKEEPDGNIVFAPEGATKGFIFYPGGKVEHTAYIPLMQACAERGVLCVLVDMPFNLAVFDMNAADEIRKDYPQIESWYIGGHSLGGAMAAAYLEKNYEDFDGLVLLGAYSTSDLSGSDLEVLSVYGSEDRVMDPVKYEECKSNLPEGFTEFSIDGGCHAYFGMYGFQEGDGTPSITNEDQIIFTADSIAEMILTD